MLYGRRNSKSPKCSLHSPRDVDAQPSGKPLGAHCLPCCGAVAACGLCRKWTFLRGAGGRPWNETGRRIGICRQYSDSVAEMSIDSPQVHPLNCLSTQGNGTATGETYRKFAISCGTGGLPYSQKCPSRSCPRWQPRPLWIGLDWAPCD